MPATKAEDRYLRLRGRFDLGSAARRYLRGHADVDGGSRSRTTGRASRTSSRGSLATCRPTAALRRLVPLPGQPARERVRYSERELNRVGERIRKDNRKLVKAGFYSRPRSSPTSAPRESTSG